MTYVASPSHADEPQARAANLRQCLETARRRLDETSDAADTEKSEELVASAVEAGWDESEVRQVLQQQGSWQVANGGPSAG